MLFALAGKDLTVQTASAMTVQRAGISPTLVARVLNVGPTASAASAASGIQTYPAPNVAPTAPAYQPPPQPQPFYEKPWFWVVVVAVTATIGIALFAPRSK